MNDLPNDILVEIILFIPEELFHLSLVNKQFYHVCKSEKIKKIWFDRLPKEIQEMSETFPKTMSSVQSLYLYKRNVYNLIII